MARSVQHALRFLGVLAVLGTPAVPAAAQVIYTNGVPDNNGAVTVNNGQLAADDFPLTSTTQLGTFDWYVDRPASSGPPATITSNFTWSIFSNAAGLPFVAPLFSASVTNATGTLTPFFCCGFVHAYDMYLFPHVSFGGLSLGSGQYWLAIGNYAETSPGIGNYNAGWATSGVGNSACSSDGGATWKDSCAAEELAFTIYGPGSTVPEPCSLALLGTGLLGLVPMMRRKYRK